MIKVYGHPMSTCTRKVLMTLAETNTPFELNVVDFMKGEHKQAPHLTRQPFGQLPALEDEGFSFYESRAMCRYINETSKGKLIPSDPKHKALMEQWISVETSNFTPYVMKFLYQYVFHREQEPGVLESAKKSLEMALATMDTQLAKTPYLVGNDISLADVVFMPYIEYAMGTPAKEIFEKYPSVMKWWKSVSERPTWKKAISN